MGCCEPGNENQSPSELQFAIAGNPNCGKSALFNTLTGIRQKTGNWPGVTVDRKEGQFKLNGQLVSIFDLPGIYSLDASSLDEQVTRDYLLSHDASLIINVVDASNLERNLYLTVQLLEMGVPLVLVLNMMDVARKRGIQIDADKLSRELGCPVVPIVAITGEGIEALKGAIQSVISGKQTGGYRLAHAEEVEQAISKLMPDLEESVVNGNRHWLALKLLESDPFALSMVNDSMQEKIRQSVQNIEDRSGEEADIHIADCRYGHAHMLAQTVIEQQGRAGRTVTDNIDQFVLSKIFGIPIFLAIMYLMFLFAINIGGAFIDFFDGVAATFFVDGLGAVLDSVGSPEWLTVVLAKGIGGGIQIVATFIPIIAALYLFLSFVEDSGYMARAAFVMDRFMRAIGFAG